MARAKTTKAVTRAASITFDVPMIHAFVGQDVSITPTLSEFKYPVTYQWYNGADGTTEMVGETSRTLKVTAAKNDTNKYKVKVTGSDGTAVTSAGQCQITATDAIAGVGVLFDVKFMEFNQTAFTPLDINVVYAINSVIDSTNNGDIFSEKLITKITEIAAVNKQLASQIYTIFDALIRYGFVIVQESRHGYYMYYTLGINKDVQYKHGSFSMNGWPDMINKWPAQPAP